MPAGRLKPRDERDEPEPPSQTPARIEHRAMSCSPSVNVRSA
jgi:hypothetical protein